MEESCRSSSSAISVTELNENSRTRGIKRQRREDSTSPCKRRRTSATPAIRATHHAASRARRAVRRAARVVNRADRARAEYERQEHQRKLERQERQRKLERQERQRELERQERQREAERQERQRELERAARLSDFYLMRRVMTNDPYTAIRNPRMSALAEHLGGHIQVDFLYVKAQMEVSPWYVVVHPATRSALHRLCAIEAGDA